jgi:hypothetical protein
MVADTPAPSKVIALEMVNLDDQVQVPAGIITVSPVEAAL